METFGHGITLVLSGGYALRRPWVISDRDSIKTKKITLLGQLDYQPAFL